MTLSRPSAAARFLAHEARGLMIRLDRVRPFSTTMPAVAAATGPRAAWATIDRHLARQRRHLREQVQAYIRWLTSPPGRRATPDDQQRRFTLLRLQFNAELDQLDIFADVLTQRSEHETGVWLAGLDALAADALTLPGRFFAPPPVLTYLDRGHGAAIRRARTRLPGGSKNPVAVIRVPRERMVGSGIGSSLVHEVGHQGGALLNLVDSLRGVLQVREQEAGDDKPAWVLWERWISEIVADFWSLAKIGVASTLGLIGVVSLPRAFVFRINVNDPHPFPWIRVKLSCAIGRALYPDPQWGRLAQMWNSMYPVAGLTPTKRRLIQLLETTLAAFVRVLINHRPETLRGKSLRQVMAVAKRQPARLRVFLEAWKLEPLRMCTAPPTLVFAVLGQARADRAISPEQESRLLGGLLRRWALRGTVGTETACGLPTLAA